MRWKGLVISLLLLSLAGCETVGHVATASDDALYELVDTHPVTGAPMVNVVSEDREIRDAQEVMRRIHAGAVLHDYRVDPPGPLLDQVQRVFGSLLAVAHRQHLPWEVHLIDDPMPNAMTFGGGVVLIMTGIFADHPGQQGWLHRTDDEVAAVLAHEIAHVTLMHRAEREMHKLFVKRARKDPFYAAAYSTEAEADADKLGILYMALAGYDPMASARVWRAAHEKHGSNPGFYLYDHPLNVQRMEMAAQAGSQVLPYYTPGLRNADWPTVLVENPLFPRSAPLEKQPGAGIVKAVGAALDMIGEHKRTKDEAKARERAARETPEYQAGLVRLVQVQNDPQGRPLVWLQFQNGARYDVQAIGVTIHYVRENQTLHQDPSCGGPAQLRAGETKWFACELRWARGATNYQVEMTGVEFR